MESEIHAVIGVNQRSKSRASLARAVGSSWFCRGRRGDDKSTTLCVDGRYDPTDDPEVSIFVKNAVNVGFPIALLI